MKIRIASVLILLATALGAWSQNIFSSDDNHAFWGARMDIDVNIPGDYQTPIANFPYKSGAGIGIGAIYNLPIIANLYFEPGATFYYDTYRTDMITNSADGYGDIITTENPTVKKCGFRIPASIGYRFDIWENASLSLFTGPEFNIGLSAKVSSKILDENGIKTNLYENNNVLGSDGAWHRFSASWNIGAQLLFSKHYVVGICGSIGMTDLPENDKITFHENALRISLGYNF